MQAIVFLRYFIGLLLLTYVWRLLFVLSAFYPEFNVDFLNYFTDTGLAITYLALIYIVYKRGQSIKKPYLFYMPCLAGLFDLIIVGVLFVPTIVNITTLFIAYPDIDMPSKKPED